MQQREQDRARAGAEINDAKRASRGGADDLQRQLDHRLGIRPRHQRRRGEFQGQAPEFLLPENARDRLAVDAPRGEGFDRVRFVRRELPVRRGDETREVEVQRGADQ